jgi:hypothetical protein
MLLVVLFAIGFLVALAAGTLLRRTRRRVLLAAAGAAVWAGYAVWVEVFASCPRQGECDKGLGIVFVGTIALGWLAGAATSSALEPLRRRTSG